MGNSDGLLPGELHEVLLTKREIDYLENLISYELSQMTKQQVDPGFFERKVCVSILKRLKENY